MNARPGLVLLLGLAAWPGSPAGIVAAPPAARGNAPTKPTPPAVTIDKAEVRVTRRIFDPKNPPSEMPPLVPPEAGVCVSEFGCRTEIGVALPVDKKRPIKATVKSVRVIVTLDITIWTALGAPQKLRDHEEAHRRICEIYYEQAEDIARRLATPLVGQVVVVPATDNASVQTGLRTLQRTMIIAYLRETNDRCSVAQKRFDEITAHGTKPIAESDAIALALKEEFAAAGR